MCTLGGGRREKQKRAGEKGREGKRKKKKKKNKKKKKGDEDRAVDAYFHNLLAAYQVSTGRSV